MAPCRVFWFSKVSSVRCVSGILRGKLLYTCYTWKIFPNSGDCFPCVIVAGLHAAVIKAVSVFQVPGSLSSVRAE